jgi:uncharacterized protein
MHAGNGELHLEVADDEAERELGLMNRTKLGRDDGMVFLFPAPSSGGFWMKNTLIPLSIAFISGTRVVAVREMVPCRADPCPSYMPGAEYDSAVEANRNWFPDHDVRVGTTVRFEGLPG